MEYERFLSYVKAIDFIQAKEMLMGIQVASYPNSKKEYQQKLHKKLHKAANPDLYESPKKVLTTEDIARMLKRG